MSNELQKKYGLLTAICLVVGTVIGSGVFFKAQDVLNETRGDLPIGIMAWGIGGAVMLACILAFSIMATKYEKVNGVVDYADVLVGPRYGYFVGWFMTVIYYPAMTSTLAWVSARYFLVFVTNLNSNLPIHISAADGGALFGPETMVVAMLFLVISFMMNALSPKIAGYFQVSTTFIKLIPLLMVIIGGLIYGLVSPEGALIENFKTVTDVVKEDMKTNPLFAAVVTTAFAYEGWIIATAINAELKNAKRNLPIALVVGGIIIVAIYILYYIGVAGGAPKQVLMEEGATVAFTNIYDKLGILLDAFVVVSCLGTLNGLMIGSSRGIYALAARRRGPSSEMFSQVDKKTNMPHNSAILGLFVCAVWLAYFYFANLSKDPGSFVWKFAFDSSELPIVTTYPLYIPIFFMFMVRSKGENFLRRFIVPLLAICASVFMVYATVYSHGIQPYKEALESGKGFQCPVLFYLIVFAVVMIIGMFFMKEKEAKVHKKKKKR
ncbi:MAG: APC family permease [Ruminococcaceae bacterium]|nr:APC family permease [Oscillospiraceae bacterium]